MQKRPTVNDVARAAGVSAMTVSRAINNKPGVGDELRRRIITLAEELGYRPSQVARSLATRQTSTVGLVVPDIANAFFAQIARGAEDVAFERGYTLFLVNTAESLSREQAALDSLWQKEIAGVILCSSRLPLDELQAQVARFPAVLLLNRQLPAAMPRVAALNVNDSLGATLALRHLVAGGRSRIALAAGPVTSLSAHRRMDGYRAALAEAGLLLDPELLEHCAPTTDGGYGAALALLARRPRLDAILAFNDLVALGAIQACQEAERAVPADVAVIGFDDIPLARLVRPQLTTVRVDLPAAGRTAMELLFGLIGDAGAAPPPVTELDPALVVRASA